MSLRSRTLAPKERVCDYRQGQLGLASILSNGCGSVASTADKRVGRRVAARRSGCELNFSRRHRRGLGARPGHIRIDGARPSRSGPICALFSGYCNSLTGSTPVHAMRFDEVGPIGTKQLRSGFPEPWRAWVHCLVHRHSSRRHESARSPPAHRGNRASRLARLPSGLAVLSKQPTEESSTCPIEVHHGVEGKSTGGIPGAWRSSRWCRWLDAP
jgi:hypothetical protein